MSRKKFPVLFQKGTRQEPTIYVNSWTLRHGWGQQLWRDVNDSSWHSSVSTRCVSFGFLPNFIFPQGWERLQPPPFHQLLKGVIKLSLAKIKLVTFARANFAIIPMTSHGTLIILPNKHKQGQRVIILYPNGSQFHWPEEFTQKTTSGICLNSFFYWHCLSFTSRERGK